MFGNRSTRQQSDCQSRRNVIVASVCSALFFIVLAFAVFYGYNFIAAIPFGLLAVYFIITKSDYILLAIAFCTPFAIDLEVFDSMKLSMPTEPLMIIFSIVFVCRLLLSDSYDSKWVRHPVSIAVLLGLAWMLVSAIMSVKPVASFKYLAARLWFVIPFFFAMIPVMKKENRIKQFLLCYGLALGVVVIYSTVRTLDNPSDLQTLHRVMKPFYNDHTAYGAILALMLPVFVHMTFCKDNKYWERVAFGLCTLLFLVGLVFSYSRAAWLSVVASFGVYFIIRFRIRWYWIASVVVLGVSLFLVNQSQIMYKMGKNQQDSALDLGDQLQSISNISTDASNLERLNRWACAFRIFADYPITGSGPGSYQLIYAPYQKSYQRSTISTDFGDLGNAHSEYIGPLTEQGIPGALLVFCVFGLSFATGVKIYYGNGSSRTRKLALALALSLLTYYVHGAFNNFLDTDKLSVPFWALTAAIVALDFRQQQRSVKGETSDQ